MRSKTIINLVRRALRSRGYEVVRCTRAERAEIAAGGKTYQELCYERALAPRRGPINLQEARFLGQLAAGIEKDGPIVEIGTLMGWSTRVIAMAKAPDRELITVDSFTWNPLELSSDAHYRITARILEDACTFHNVVLKYMDKQEFYESYSGPTPSMFFCDAIHTYEETRADIQWAKSVGSPVICGHDYDDEWPGVIQAVDEQGGPRERVGSLWVL